MISAVAETGDPRVADLRQTGTALLAVHRRTGVDELPTACPFGIKADKNVAENTGCIIAAWHVPNQTAAGHIDVHSTDLAAEHPGKIRIAVSSTSRRSGRRR